MANRAFLNKKSGENFAYEFEAENTIPLFWLCLLDLSLVEKDEKELLESFEDYLDEYFTLKIPKETFITNLRSARRFIENNYIEQLNLYADFTNYLDKSFSSTDLLELDLLEMANFSDGKTFIKDLKNILGNIHSNVNELTPFSPDKELSSFVGYCWTFREHSNEYHEYLRKQEEAYEADMQKIFGQTRSQRIKSLLSNVGMCLLGVVFLVGSIWGIFKGGFHPAAIGGIVMGLMSVAYGALKIKGSI